MWLGDVMWGFLGTQSGWWDEKEGEQPQQVFGVYSRNTLPGLGVVCRPR